MAIHGRNPLFLTIALIYLLGGSLYATLTPPWQNADEPAHYNYIRYVATTMSLPELVSACYDQPYLNLLTTRRFPPDLSIEAVCYEFHQPPLYYLFTTPIFILTHGSLLALRFISVLCGLGTVITAFAITHTLYPRQPTLAYGSMAFTAFVPMHTAMLAAVNNDALAGLLLALMLLVLIQIHPHPQPLSQGKRGVILSPPLPLEEGLGVREKVREKSLTHLGLLLGLILLTKLTVYLAIVLVGLALILPHPNPRLIKRGRKIAPYIAGLKIYGLAALVAGPWYLRNLWLYGQFDVVGLGRHNAVVVGQLRTFDHVAAIGWPTYFHDLGQTTFHSFWGQFGWMAVPMDGRVYTALILFCCVALSGLLWDADKRGLTRISGGKFYSLALWERAGVRELWLMGLTIALTLAEFSWYNWQFIQFQGRYLFPAIIPLALLFNIGLQTAFSPTQCGRLVLILGLSGSGLLALSPDKWTLVITALPFAIAMGRAYLNIISAEWLMGACYIALAGLTLTAPFWFIAPNLSP